MQARKWTSTAKVERASPGYVQIEMGDESACVATVLRCMDLIQGIEVLRRSSREANPWS